MLRILITDDHALIRLGLKQLLLAGFGKCVIGEASNGREALDKVAGGQWDVLVLDITMPGRSGIDVLRDIKTMRPNLPVLILSACSEDQFALRSMRTGASGYLRKESAPEELVEAIKRVTSGHKYITPSLAEKLASSLGDDKDKAPHESLSDREYEVMCLIAKGCTPTKIAKSLSLSVKTISTYRTRILEKLHLSSNAELTYYAIKNGLVE
jgi:two-component system, NarL family, invasion response regulator UvrY